MDVSADHLIARARERFAVQDYYGAIHLLEDIIASGRAFADAYHLLGVSFSLLGQQDRALRHFDKALALNPRYFEAHVHRGIVLNELGRREDADASFHAAAGSAPAPVGNFPGQLAARLANHHASLGRAYAEAGAIDEALREYRRAMELGPTFADLRYQLSRLLLESGRTLEARDELERIMRERPNFLAAQAALGLARYLSGDAGGAEEIWKAVLEKRPADARVEAYLAMMERNES